MVPQVEFKIKNAEEVLKEINEMSPEEIAITLEEHLQLRKLIARATSEDEIMRIVNRYFRQFQNEIKGKMMAIVKTFQKTWNSANEEYMKNVFDLLELEMNNYPKFIANLTYSPIEKINYETNEFDIYNIGDNDVKKMKRVISHFILSTLLEKKLDELKINGSYIKELAMVSLTADSKYQKAFTHKPLIGDTYKMILIGDNFLQTHINKFYKEKTSLNDFLKKTADFVKENESSIKEQLEY